MYNNPAKSPLFRMLAPFGIGATVYLLILLAFDTVGRITDDFINKELLVCIGISFLVLEANRFIALSFLTKTQAGKRYLIAGLTKVLFAVFVTILITSFSLIIYFKQVEGLYDISSFSTELNVFDTLFGFIALIYQSYFLGFVWLYHQYKLKIIQEEEAKRNIERKIESFHESINPDFLFSSLEGIILKIKEQDLEYADKGLLMLSDIYHYFLKQKEELVTLEEEIDAMRKMVRLLNLYGLHNIHVKVECEGDNRLIIPCTLVKLVEVISQSQLNSSTLPLKIKVELQNSGLRVQFSNNPSLRNFHKLPDFLEVIKSKSLWLSSNEVEWSDGEYFSIFIPTGKFENKKVPVEIY